MPGRRSRRVRCGNGKGDAPGSEIDDDLFESTFGNDLEQLGIDRTASRAAKLGHLLIASRLRWQVYFGLDQLFESIPAERDPGSEIPDIEPREFIRLTGELDLFGLGGEARALGTAHQLRQRLASIEGLAGKKSEEPASADRLGWLGRWAKRRNPG